MAPTTTTVAAVAAMLLIAALAPAAARSDETRREVEQLHKDLDRAINDRDADRAANLFANDAIMVSSMFGRVEGREEIRRVFRAMMTDLRGSQLRHQFNVDRVSDATSKEDNERAFASGRWRIRGGGESPSDSVFSDDDASFGLSGERRRDENVQGGSFSSQTRRENGRRVFEYAQCGIARYGRQNERREMMPFLQEYHQAMRAAIREGRCDEWANMFTQDAVVIPGGRGNPPIRGRKEIERACQEQQQRWKREGIRDLFYVPDAMGQAGSPNAGEGRSQNHIYSEGFYLLLDRDGRVVDKGVEMKVARRDENDGGRMRLASVTWEPEQGLADRLIGGGRRPNRFGLGQ